MFYRITNCVKKIIIQELQELFNDHPIFGNGELLITNKFSSEERPKYALILKTASADSLKLSLDNFKGTIQSYTTLANLKGKPGRMIEWVREDVKNVKNLVKPGYYVVNMIEEDEFIIDPYLTVADEILEIENSGFYFANLKNQNINPGSEQLITETSRLLMRNQHYTIDNDMGQITFLKPIDEEWGTITIDYQYIGERNGPFHVKPETANIEAVPGVIIAFGNHLTKGGIQVVVVYPNRQSVAQSYLGKWKMTLNLSAIAQDTDTQEQLVDLASMYLWSVLQEKLVNDGVYIDTFSISGETEDDEVKTSNELSYFADISFNVEVEWEAFQPILGVIKRVFLNRIEDFGKYDDAEHEIRSSRPFNASQSGVDYSVGLQPTENLEPYIIRPVPKYTIISSQTNISR